MIFNLVIIFITILIGLIFSDTKITPWSEEIKRKRYIWIISIVLILQSGLRNVAVGADTYAYYRSFEQVKQMDWSSVLNTVSNYYSNGVGKDPGYVVLQKIVQSVIGDYQIFLFLIAILFFAALANFISKNTKGLWEAMFAFILYSSLFYAFFSITGHRQTIATAATLLSFELIKKRKLLPFLVLVLIASTIHRSCLIFLPFYFLFGLRRSNILYPIAMIGFFVFMFYREPVSEILRNIGGYTQSQYGYSSGAGTLTFTAMLLLVAFIAWWRMKYVLHENENARPFYNAFILAIVFTPLTWVNPNAMRVVQYFSIFLLVLIPTILESFSNTGYNLRKFAYAVAIIGLIVLAAKSEWGMEYKFFWQPMELGPNYTHGANPQ